jgi:hypothetical protein
VSQDKTEPVEDRIFVAAHSDSATLTTPEDPAYSVFTHNGRCLVLFIGHELFDPNTGRLADPPEGGQDPISLRIAEAVLAYQQEHPVQPISGEALLREADTLLKAFKGDGEDPEPEQVETWLERVSRLPL